MLKKLYIDNYRSFSNTTIEFGQFNCLIGPNNAGKSNLIDALEFLDIAIFADIDKAVKDKGGFDKIKNYRTNSNTITIRAEFTAELIGCFGYDLASSEHTIDVQLTVSRKDDINTFIKDIRISGKLKNIRLKESEKSTWSINNAVLSFGSKDPINITRTLLTNGVSDIETRAQEFVGKRAKSFSLSLNQINENNKIEFDDGTKEDVKNLVSRIFGLKFFNRLEMGTIFCTRGLFDSYFFVPYLIRKHRVNERNLNKEGTTLINCLSDLRDLFKETIDEISYSLIGEIEVATGIKSSSIGGLPELEIVESLADGTFKNLNIMQASEGTIHFIAIMTALSTPFRRFMIMIEEPERSLHMRTLSYIIEKCRNNSSQIFITTHSSELLRMLNPKEISFVYRNRNGKSKVKMASQIPHLSKMMKRTKYDIVELIQTGIVGDFEDDE
jgi:predicted ATPase